MSERGYDSDAQFIASPRGVTLNSPGSGRDLSPLGQGYAKTELSDLSERSNEWIVEGFDGIAEDDHHDEVNLPPGEMDGVQEGAEGSNCVREGFEQKCESGRGSMDKGLADGIVGVEKMTEEPVCEEPVHQGDTEASTAAEEAQEEQDKSPANPPEGNPPEMLQSELVESSKVANANEPIIPETEDEPILVHENHGAEAIDPKPSDSASKLISEIQIPKKRLLQEPPNRSVSEMRSIHLADMNIHKTLASPSLLSTSFTSPMLSQNPSVEESRQEDMSIRRSVSENSGTKMLQQLQLGQHQKQSTLFYSPRSSLSTPSTSLYQHPPKTWGHSGIEKYLTKLERQTPCTRSPLVATLPGTFPVQGFDSKEPSEANPIESHTLAVDAFKGKFLETLQDVPPVANSTSQGKIGESFPGPRKVSIGWMSGGRRIGYGYTMVPPTDKENLGSRTNVASSSPSDAGNRSRSETPSKLNGSSSSINAIPGMLNRLGERHWSGATAFLRKEEPIDRKSFSAPLWTRVTNRVKSQVNATGIARTMPGHWPVFGSEQSSDVGRDQHEPRKQMPVLGPKDGNFLKRTMTRIYSTSSLPTRRRNMMENSHDIREKISAKTPGVHYPLLHRKGSGNFRFRTLSLHRKKMRRSADDEVPIFTVKNCGWSREDMTRKIVEPAWVSGLPVSAAASVSGPGSGSVSAVVSNGGRDAGESLSLDQVVSDDTTEDLASMYQDCFETIPGSVDGILALSEERKA